MGDLINTLRRRNTKNIVEANYVNETGQDVLGIAGEIMLVDGTGTPAPLTEWEHTTTVEHLLTGADIGYIYIAENVAPSADFKDASNIYSESTVAVGYTIKDIFTSNTGTVDVVYANTSMDTTMDGTGVWTLGSQAAVPGVVRAEINMDTYKNLSIQYKISAGTPQDTIYLLLYGTNIASATPDNDVDWVNLSLDLLGDIDGLTFNNTTGEGIIFIDSSIVVLKLMVKIVSESTDVHFDNAYDIYIKKT